MPIFEWRSVMPASADEVFAYHARPGRVPAAGAAVAEDARCWRRAAT